MPRVVIGDPALVALLTELDKARKALTEDPTTGNVKAAWILGKLEGQLIDMLRPKTDNE